ncbi:hypothetical protein MNBD_PLANCTO02-231 [hydrothermal vent metagenome]|uniref:Inositolphosphotransferase Aur1/Ipt1 domain-containing protein n=1 Tax=hydrothermal vent metagenome TaxID=652676 RepID=A0A3B1DQ35_9ZZZZ
MKRDTLLKFILTAGILVVGLLLMLWNGLTLSTDEIIFPIQPLCVIVPFAFFFRVKKNDTFGASALAIVALLAFLPCLTIMIYAGTPLNAPLIDSWLMQSDALMGISLPGIVQWAEQHPGIDSLLKIAYGSVFLQTISIIFLLGLLRDKIQLNRFVLQFMLSVSLISIIYFFLPAVGPFEAYGYEPSASQLRYLKDFQGFRNGSMTNISLVTFEGMVTFPSFHTTWAILLMASMWHRKWLFLPAFLLNICVIAATLTTGWHYGTDVIAGGIVAGITIWASVRMQQWLEKDAIQFIEPAEFSPQV